MTIPALPNDVLSANPEFQPDEPQLTGESVDLSRETPLLIRARQALNIDQPTSGRIYRGAGRFGQMGESDFGDVQEGPGLLDVLLPDATRKIRERFSKPSIEEESAEEALPPTFLTRLNGLFFNHLLSDATLPFSMRNPGPDLANFPNSAYTIERGHLYFETQPVQITGPSNAQAYTYSAGYLMRFGLTDRVEFRLFSNGITYQSAYQGNKRSGVGLTPAATGWSPLFIDFKVNFWEQRIRSLMPAMGMEVFVSTETGSQAFHTGVTYGIALLFDYNFGRGWNLEWNIGIQPANANVPDLPDAILPVFNAQWSIQRAVTDNLAVYLHGYYNDAALPQFGGNTVVGVGALYFIGNSWSVWADYNVGLEKYVGPAFTYTLGFSYAF